MVAGIAGVIAEVVVTKSQVLITTATGINIFKPVISIDLLSFIRTFSKGRGNFYVLTSVLIFAN